MVMIACEGKLCDRRQFRRRGTPKPDGVPRPFELDSIGFWLHQFGFDGLQLGLTISTRSGVRAEAAAIGAVGTVGAVTITVTIPVAVAA